MDNKPYWEAKRLIAGGATLAKTAAALNALGYSTPRGKKWTKSNLSVSIYRRELDE